MTGLVAFVNEALAELDPALVLRSDAVALVERLTTLVAEEADRPAWLVVSPEALALLDGETGVIEPEAGYDAETDSFSPAAGPAGICRGTPLYLDPELTSFGVAIP